MYKLLIGFIVLINTNLFCLSQLDSLIKAGLYQSYSFEFEQSEETFNNIIDLYPDQPEGYFYLSQNHLWFYLGSRDEGELRTFEKYTELAFEKTEALLSENDKSAYYTEMMGNLALQEAMVEASEESTLSAFFSTKSAYSYFEDALEIDSTYYRAYLGLGLLEYALSYVPGMFKWAIDISGLGRDKEKGYEYVCKANNNAVDLISRTESSFHKAKMLAEYMGDPVEAASILDSLTALFPENLLFKYQLALAQIDSRQLNSAETNLLYIINNPDERFIQTIAFSYFLLGEVNFKNNEFNSAIEYFNKFLEKSRGFEYAGMAYYNIALADMMLDDIIKAKKFLVLARNGNSDISDDLYAARRSELIYEQIPVNELKTLIKAKNFLSSGSYGDVIDSLTSTSVKFTGDNLIESELILAEAYLCSGQNKPAGATLEKVSLSKIETEEWLVPQNYYLKAKYNFEKGNLSEASRNLELAYENNNHDFIEKITAKLNYVRNRIISSNSSEDFD